MAVNYSGIFYNTEEVYFKNRNIKSHSNLNPRKSGKLRLLKKYYIGPWAQCYQFFIVSIFFNFRNKLECLYMAIYSSLV